MLCHELHGLAPLRPAPWRLSWMYSKKRRYVEPFTDAHWLHHCVPFRRVAAWNGCSGNVAAGRFPVGSDSHPSEGATASIARPSVSSTIHANAHKLHLLKSAPTDGPTSCIEAAPVATNRTAQSEAVSCKSCRLWLFLLADVLLLSVTTSTDLQGKVGGVCAARYRYDVTFRRPWVGGRLCGGGRGVCGGGRVGGWGGVDARPVTGKPCVRCHTPHLPRLHVPAKADRQPRRPLVGLLVRADAGE